MDCKEIHELLPDLAAGFAVSTPEAEKHIASCGKCPSHRLISIPAFRRACVRKWRARLSPGINACFRAL